MKKDDAIRLGSTDGAQYAERWLIVYGNPPPKDEIDWAIKSDVMIDRHESAAHNNAMDRDAARAPTSIGKWRHVYVKAFLEAVKRELLKAYLK
jgi:hypothetical protein